MAPSADNLLQRTGEMAETAKGKEQEVLSYVRRHGLVRDRQLRALGWSPVYLRRLKMKGLVEQISRGLYAPVASKLLLGEHQSLAMVTKRCPTAKVCLLSALQ